MLGVLANDADHPISPDYLAFVTNRFDTCSHFHVLSPFLYMLGLLLANVEPIVVVHLHDALNLAHGIKVDTNQDE
jgi:hypothetical protein